MGKIMLSHRSFWVFLFFVLQAGLASSAQADRLQVAVSIVPQKYFAQQIGGDRVEVTVVVPPGSNPATYEPKPSQMLRMEEAELYLSLGVPFERAWLKRLQGVGSQMRLVPCQEGIERRAMHTGLESLGPASDKSASKTGRNAHSKEHQHGLDPHIWLSPPLARIMAMNIRDAFVSLDPEHAAGYRNRYLQLAKEINAVDNKLLSLFAKSKGSIFLVYHPSWGYFAEAYGLRQVPIELEGKEPSPRELSQLIRFAKRHSVGTIFVQPQFSQQAARTVASSLGAHLVELDPLAEDWPSNLVRTGERIAEALR